MQNVLLNDEQTEIQRTLARFAKERIVPFASQWDDEERFPRELMAPLADLGLTAMTIPDEWQGAKQSRLSAAVAYESLATADLSTVVWLAVHNMAAGIIAQFGADSQKQKYLPEMAKGVMLGAFSLSEAHAGSDPASLRTTAKYANGSYTLSGTKTWVTSGNVADVIIVMAREPGTTGSKGISSFIVESGTPGFTVGKIERKMGLHASPTAELIFDNCVIAEEQRIGAEGAGLKIALSALDSGRINIAAAAAGTAKAALEIATAYAQERQQFGKPIAEFQGVQFMLADMAVQIEAAELLTFQAAATLDAYGSATREAAMAKLFSTGMAQRVVSDAIQILGGAGYVKDWPLERFMRDLKVTEIFEGTSQIQRIVIARSLLKKSK